MKQQIKNNLILWALNGALRAVGWLNHRQVLAAGGCLGGWFHDLVSRDRERARAHLELAYPRLSHSECGRIARRVFVHMGQNAFEFLKMNSLETPQILALVEAVEGRENMERARAKGCGVVCLTAHLGNWEILPIFTNAQGWPSAVVAQQLYDARLDATLNAFRETHGVKVLKRQAITRDIIRCLRQNMLLGILNDQDTRVDSRWAPFFGRSAKTPVGILRLARKTKAAVVPIFIARQPSGRNRIYIDPELPFAVTGDEEADLRRGAELCNQAIEKYVRRFPEQWVWFHQRWKSREAEAGGGQ